MKTTAEDKPSHATSTISTASAADQQLSEEHKCEQLMELFYHVYDELQKLHAQKKEFDRRMHVLQEEQT